MIVLHYALAACMAVIFLALTLAPWAADHHRLGAVGDAHRPDGHAS